MTRKNEINTQISKLQNELTALNRVADDTFNVGTVMVFSAKNNTVHWYIRKIAVDTWTAMEASGSLSKDLASFIADALESDVGYFEVYELRVQNNPFFTSA